MKSLDKKILIVDDERPIVEILKINLQKENYIVFEAYDGEEAVSKYKEFKPDVVFMDIIMPKVTGLEALKQIIAEDPDAKVIMASSVGTQSHLKDALKSGAVDFLQKPIADNDALKVLENVAKGVL